MPRKTKTKKAKAGGVTKLEAMRQALNELGQDAPPVTIQPFLKERFGLEMTRDYISKYKSHAIKTLSSKSKSPAKQAAPAPTAVKAAPPSKHQAKPTPASDGKAGGISLQDIEAVKGLVGRVGVDSLRRLIDLLAK